MSGRFRLVSGEDGEKYVIPVERTAEFHAWLYSTDWENGVSPEWAQCVDGRLTFTDPRCE